VKSLLLATSNPGKIGEFQALLSAHFLCLSPGHPQVSSLQAPEVTEDGATYFENALKKARAYQEVYRMPVLADDSGLEVDVLEGRPGVYSARFGGATISWEKRWQLLFAQLAGFSPDRWTGQFRAVLCYYDGGLPHFFEGTTRGCLTAAPRGSEGFGYDPIFVSDDLAKTFAEASQEEKSRVSHRGKAVREFLSWANS
jgi:XTP/dITP diphosphohydrolase